MCLSRYLYLRCCACMKGGTCNMMGVLSCPGRGHPLKKKLGPPVWRNWRKSVDAVVLGAILKKVQVQVLCFANA